ncbi:hypothetical protein Poli38472_007149 [Pythium oligandrum]|uniref:Complex 1 LYR protein domain-containing protein n=1 Tax=Pythium oligandrum TaxID=41045 RepID=A0A8K1C967_PYTOL|nr:hypothetical protein Poli38472_007149 [Pythium oligandrum]|eukprot:TMW59004.1 hypothetical protein Poli38472_007149 [Pythium oligandrum]
MRGPVLTLFRAVARTARAFPDPSMGKKLLFNARELIRLRRHERDPRVIQRHLDDGHLALRVYKLLQTDEQLRRAITRKQTPPS